MSLNEQSLQNVISFSELLDEGLSVFSRKEFEMAKLCSFLLADCHVVKVPFRFDFAKRMTFSVSNFVFGGDQLMLTCFQMWLSNPLKKSGQVSHGIKKIQT